jgi:hypothetical protein
MIFLNIYNRQGEHLTEEFLVISIPSFLEILIARALLYLGIHRSSIRRPSGEFNWVHFLSKLGQRFSQSGEALQDEWGLKLVQI